MPNFPVGKNVAVPWANIWITSLPGVGNDGNVMVLFKACIGVVAALMVVCHKVTVPFAVNNICAVTDALAGIFDQYGA